MSVLRDVVIGTWAQTEACVGRVLASFTGADPVSTSDIRRRLEVLAWNAPIHYDEAAARRAGYRGIVSPATMVITLVLPAYWQPGDPRPEPGDPLLLPRFALRQIPAPGGALFATECATRYLEPVYVGDRVSGEVRFVAFTRKKLRIGDGAFMTAETRYSNQHGAVVAVEEITVFRYTPAAESDATSGEGTA